MGNRALCTTAGLCSLIMNFKLTLVIGIVISLLSGGPSGRVVSRFSSVGGVRMWGAKTITLSQLPFLYLGLVFPRGGGGGT